MTYDDLEATERIRNYWASLMKTLNPKLHEYMMRAKYEYSYPNRVDRWDGDPDLLIEHVIDWAEREL